MTTDTESTAAYGGADNLEVMAEAVNYNRFLVDEIARHRPATSTSAVLDFGAGSGTFARAIQARGLRVECVETDRRLSEALRAGGFRVFSSLGEIPNASLDYIYSLNVLEHIEDDQAVLNDMFRCLRPGGSLYLYVPAFQVIYSSMDRKVGHLRRYRASALASLVRKPGFEVLEHKYCDSLGFVASLVYKVLGSRRGDINPSTIRFYDRFAFPVSRALDLAFSPFFGKNVGLAARKPTV